MTNATLTEEDIDCMFGSLRRLLEEQRSGGSVAPLATLVFRRN
jgi:hypothetical protein